MSGEQERPATINCGCGCFGCLSAVVSMVLLCYIFNCGWAKNIVLRCIREVSIAWHCATSSASGGIAPAALSEDNVQRKEKP